MEYFLKSENFDARRAEIILKTTHLNKTDLFYLFEILGIWTQYAQAKCHRINDSATDVEVFGQYTHIRVQDSISIRMFFFSENQTLVLEKEQTVISE